MIKIERQISEEKNIVIIYRIMAVMKVETDIIGNIIELIERVGYWFILRFIFLAFYLFKLLNSKCHQTGKWKWQ